MRFRDAIPKRRSALLSVVWSAPKLLDKSHNRLKGTASVMLTYVLFQARPNSRVAGSIRTPYTAAQRLSQSQIPALGYPVLLSAPRPHSGRQCAGDKPGISHRQSSVIDPSLHSHIVAGLAPLCGALGALVCFVLLRCAPVAREAAGQKCTACCVALMQCHGWRRRRTS